MIILSCSSKNMVEKPVKGRQLLPELPLQCCCSHICLCTAAARPSSPGGDQRPLGPVPHRIVPCSLSAIGSVDWLKTKVGIKVIRTL